MFASSLLFYWRDIAWCLVIIFTSVYLWFQIRFTHWTSKGIEGPSPVFPAGNIGSVFLKKKQFFQPFIECYSKYKHLPYVGMYTLYNPVLVVNDADLIRKILVKDFGHFAMHGTTACAEIDPLSMHLFNLHGDKWRTLRNMITPTFSSGKLKILFENMITASKEMLDYLDKKNGVEDMSAVFANYSLDVIGRVAFGVECNCFGDPNSTYKKNVHEFLEPSTFYCLKTNLSDSKELRKCLDKLYKQRLTWKQTAVRARIDKGVVLLKSQVVRTLWFLTPELFKKLKIQRIKPEVTEFFVSLVRETAEYRNTNNVERNDFLQMLLQIKNNNIKYNYDGAMNTCQDGSMSWAEMAGNTMMYLAAGYETSSTTASFAIYELAQQPHVLKRTREEVLAVIERHNGQITYESLSEMTYLSLVIEETLRKHPPMRALFRRCTKDYVIPGTKTNIEKGTWVFIPVQGLQNDPEIFPDPHVFDPSRFLPENKTEKQSAVYMPFGEGPKMCLGIRFGVMSTKLALASFLARYDYSLDSRTPVPVRYKTSSLPLAIDPGLYVHITPVENASA